MPGSDIASPPPPGRSARTRFHQLKVWFIITYHQHVTQRPNQYVPLWGESTRLSQRMKP